MLNLAVLRAYEALLAKYIPGFRVKYKESSTFMKVLAFLIFPFNPEFQDRYTTTIGKTVYFPSKEQYEARPEKSFFTLFHEAVHLWDEKEHPFLFKLSYLFPQILAIIPLTVFAILAGLHSWVLLALLASYVAAAGVARKSMIGFWVTLVLLAGATLGAAAVLTGWLCLVLVVVVACLVPWPSRWRVKWEGRGYAATIAASVWLNRSIDIERVEGHFTGPDYYFMSWSKEQAEKIVVDASTQARIGTLQELPPYSFTYDFLYLHGLLHR